MRRLILIIRWQLLAVCMVLAVAMVWLQFDTHRVGYWIRHRSIGHEYVVTGAASCGQAWLGRMDRESIRPNTWVFQRLPSPGPIVTKIRVGPKWMGLGYTPWSGPNSWHGVAFPFWLPAIIFALPPMIVAGRGLMRRERGSENCCKQCGYDLRATPERCPECGTVVAKPVSGGAIVVENPVQK